MKTKEEFDAQIVIRKPERKLKHLGTFNSLEEADKAFDCENKIQVTYEEAAKIDHMHILHYKDDELHNDLYFIAK